MPRAIDLTPQNLQVTNNPNNTIGLGPGSLQGLFADIANIPAVTLEMIEQFINQFLTYFDQATGIDLLPLVKDVEAFINALLGIFGLGTFTGGQGSAAGTSLGNELELPITILTDLLSFLGLGSVLGSGSGPALTTWFGDLLSLFGNPVGLGSGHVDVLAWATSFIDNILNPTGLLASITGIVDAITGTSGNLSFLTSWFDDLLSLLGDPTGLGSGAPGLAAVGNIPILGPLINLLITSLGGVVGANPISILIGLLENLLNIFSPLNALSLFGQIPLDLLGLLPAGSVTSAQPNMLLNPSFDGPNSMAGQSVWSWTGTTYSTGTGGASTTQPGSATVTANGLLKQLWANITPVSQGQQLSLSVNSLFQNLVAAGQPIQLVLQTFADRFGQNLLGTTVIAQAGNADGTAPTSWTGAPAGSQQANLMGTYTVPAGTNAVSTGLQVTSAASSGQVWFSNANQSFVDTLAPFGANTMADALTSIVDGIYNGFTNSTQYGTGLALLSNIANQIASIANQALGIAQDNSALLGKRSISRPGFHAVDPTLDGVFDLTSLTGTTPTTIPVTQAQSAIGFIHVTDNAEKGSIAWLGSGVGGISSALVNLYSVDKTSGTMTWQWSSNNVLPQMSSAMSWVYVPMPATISTPIGTVWAVELQTAGTGTHSVVGMPNHWLPANSTVNPQQLAATRLATATPPFGAIGTPGHSFNASSASPMSASGSHTIASADNYVIMYVGVGLSAAAMTAATVTATYGGTAMSLLGQVQYVGSSPYYWVSAYGLANPPSGAQATNVSVAFSGTAATAILDFNTFSYSQVSGTPTTVTNSGSSTAASVSGSGTNAQQTVVAGFFSSTTTANFSAPSGTQRANIASSSTQNPRLIEDVAGSAGLSVTATLSASSAWGGVGVVLSGAMITAPATMTPIYSGSVPFFALSSGLQGTTGTHAAYTTEYSTPGSYQYFPDGWANYVDLVGIGGGGAGQGEQGYDTGGGGGAGTWNAQTLHIGVDIPSGNAITVTVGQAGQGPTGYYANGRPGNATTFTWTDTGGTQHSLSCAGGPGGGSFTWNVGGGNGQSAGNYTYQGTTYFGGAGAGGGGTGGAPGGGGGGAPPFLSGGSGGDGAAWAVARQT